MQANLMAITADTDQKFSALRAVDSENGGATESGRKTLGWVFKAEWFQLC